MICHPNYLLFLDATHFYKLLVMLTFFSNVLSLKQIHKMSLKLSLFSLLYKSILARKEVKTTKKQLNL